MIEEYKFGLIKINGKEYRRDIELHQNGEVLDWWRRESHTIDLEDLDRALKHKPDILIIGTGASGIAEVTERAKAVIESREIELIVDITDEAIKAFNLKTENSTNKVIGLFHLTC